MGRAGSSGPEPGLTLRHRISVDASVAIALARWDALAAAFDEAIAAGAEDLLEEILLQSYLFLGFPRALTALGMWRSHSGRTAPPPTRDDVELWTDRGVEVCRAVYGSAYEGLRESVRVIHPDVDRWMVAEGYGKVLGRPGATLLEREIAIVALLAVLGSPRQLHSHLRGALQVGATEEMVVEALTRAGKHGGLERAGEAESVWTEVQERWRGTRPIQQEAL